MLSRVSYSNMFHIRHLPCRRIGDVILKSVLLWSLIISQFFIPHGSSSIICQQKVNVMWVAFEGAKVTSDVLRCYCDGGEKSDSARWLYPDIKMANTAYTVEGKNLTFELRESSSQYSSDVYVDVIIMCGVVDENGYEGNISEYTLKMPLGRSEDPTYVSDSSDILHPINIALGALCFVLLVIFIVVCVAVSRSKNELKEELLNKKTLDTSYLERKNSSTRYSSDENVNETNNFSGTQSVTITISPNVSLDTSGLDEDKKSTSVQISRDKVNAPGTCVDTRYPRQVPRRRTNSDTLSHGSVNHGTNFKRKSDGFRSGHGELNTSGAAGKKLDDQTPPVLPPRDKSSYRLFRQTPLPRDGASSHLSRSLSEEGADYRDSSSTSYPDSRIYRRSASHGSPTLPPQPVPRTFMSLPRKPHTHKSPRSAAAPW